ncbi:hypothetical protein BC936DRAFT_149627 [Jimgerdemannia flammicorona]|uniref:Uncharacterized protein n=1 Tax=Jimgerdemannia flammicorona TaxID=994334 RepID=A0A433D0F5_9FUNG|nr:hypothetical protein BC936DRAFT_149627 [Jimgerdemannia flammicorona]
MTHRDGNSGNRDTTLRVPTTTYLPPAPAHFSPCASSSAYSVPRRFGPTSSASTTTGTACRNDGKDYKIALNSICNRQETRQPVYRYTALPVSDIDEKVDPNAEPAQEEQPRRGWCQRWRARCCRNGEDTPNRRRWRILRRILLAFVFVHLVGHAFRYLRFRRHRNFYEPSTEGSPFNEYYTAQYHPERTEPDFYSADLADQDPVAQDLLDKFYYLFEWPNDGLGAPNQYDSLEDVIVPEDMLELTEVDAAVIAGERDMTLPEEIEMEDEDRGEGEDEDRGEGEDEDRGEGEDEGEGEGEDEGEDKQGSDEDEQGPDGRRHKHRKHHKDHKHPKHPHHKHPPPSPHPRPHPHPPHRKPKIECKDKDLTPWKGPTEFTFSPDEYKSVGVLLDGGVLPLASVKVTQLTAESTSSLVTIKLSVLLGDKHQQRNVAATAFDHNGAYVVEITTPKHRREGKPSTKNCIKIAIEVIFPAGLTNYDALKLRLSSAVVKGYGLDGIKFENVTAGVGHGALLFQVRFNVLSESPRETLVEPGLTVSLYFPPKQQINAENVRLGAIRGIIRGHFDIGNNVTVGTVHGFSHINVNPTGEDIRVKASAVSGIVGVQIPSDAYEGRFVLATLFGRPIIQAPNPADIHIERLRYNYKVGYYKNKTDSIAILTAKHGAVNLTFV